MIFVATWFYIDNDYDKEIANINGYLYGVRRIYGPYEYVVEEF